ncbi:HNH endonuclease [Ruania alba]|uniref:HNH endonuclease n=2 Tax=Ruania alba TaxID=648782 RepID=A0A1H5FVA9_9MICO|nr:HNH endonuclease [Ruania alba]
MSGAGLDPMTGPTSPTGTPGGAGGMGRTVMLYLHLPADALNDHAEAGTGESSGTGEGAGNSGETGPEFGCGVVGRCENTRSPVSKEQIRHWCGTAGRILVRPVIDLAGFTSASTYEASPTLREQVILRDGRCRFPYCNRSARSADQDHSVPFDQGGRTSSVNMAALCRRHHRAKTHAGWSYSMITPGVYYWAAPDGVLYLVTPTGTYPIPSAGSARQPGSSPPGGHRHPPHGAAEPPGDPGDPGGLGDAGRHAGNSTHSDPPGHTDPPPD